MIEVRRGDLWWVALAPAVGSEIAKRRPCLVVQRDAANAVSPTTIVCPLTRVKARKARIVNVAIPPDENGLSEPSVVVCTQIRAVDLRRFGAKIGRVDAATMAAVKRGLVAALDL